MYIPPHFAETDRARLHDFIERYSFGLLVSTVAGAPFASHLPFLLERDTGPYGTLVGHLARANPQWHDLDGREVLTVFSGPHAYVSPTWYETDGLVPTWNYAAVHAYGTFRAIHDPTELTALVTRFTDNYEATMPQPWRLDASSAKVDALVRQIVGFHVEMARLEGKWKLNQNHPPERRVKVRRALEARGDAESLAAAALMREREADNPDS